MLDITSSDITSSDYDIIRQTLVTNISSQLNLVVTLPSILFGNKTLTETDNMKFSNLFTNLSKNLSGFNIK